MCFYVDPLFVSTKKSEVKAESEISIEKVAERDDEGLDVRRASNLSTNSKATSYAQKMAAASGFGGGMPGLIPGIIFTKPS